MSISVFKPFINRKDMDSVLNCLVNEKLSSGPVSKELAGGISDFLGIEEGYLVKEYRRAIEILLKSVAAEAAERKKVVMSPLAPVYFRLAAEDCGLEAIFVDVDPDTACISHEKLENAVSEFRDSIHSIIVDSPLGFVPAIDKIMETGFPVIEDISNSLGASARDRKLGSFGSFTVMSLDPDKIITTGGGVFIGAAGKKEKENLKNLVSLYGRDILLPDVNAAAALFQLAGLDKLISARSELAEFYCQAVMKTRNKTLVQKDGIKNVYYSFPVIAESSTKEIKKYAQKKGVDVSDAFGESIINSCKTENCPEAAGLLMRCILFPLYPNIGKANAEKIIKVISTLP